MKQTTYALIDCNNFFVSCERIFRPDLWRKPTAVLSNNDGCIVARSQEVKDLKIPMGAPYFKWEDVLTKNDVTLFSGNFRLYGDISNRVMSVLEDFSPEIEVYSIDEAFINLTNLRIQDYKEFGDTIVRTVQKRVGVPVSVGIASTKTLCKLANEIGKMERRFQSTTDLTTLSNSEIDSRLEKLKVGEIWGIGRNRVDFLKKNGVYTAKDFKYANRPWVKKNLSVLGERTHLEMNNIPCFKVDDSPNPKKGIASTRSFGNYVTEKAQMKEAVASYVAIAAKKLRKQKSVCSSITVYVRTNKFGQDPYYSNAYTISMDDASDYTPGLIKSALKALDKIWIQGKRYKKAGVYLTDISPKHSKQMSLHSVNDIDLEKNQDKVTNAVDSLNNKWGSYTVQTAVEGVKKKWKMKRELSSPEYTTRWEEILKVRI